MSSSSNDTTESRYQVIDRQTGQEININLAEYAIKHIDSILLGIVLVAALCLKMEVLAILTGAIVILGPTRTRAFSSILLDKLEKSKKGALGPISWEEQSDTTLPDIKSDVEPLSGVTTTDFVAYYERARAASQANDYAQAKILLLKAYEMDHENLEVNIALGIVYNVLKQNEKAINHNRAALKIDPDNFIAQFNLAVATNHLLGFRKSLSEYLKAEEIATKKSMPETVTIGKLNLFIGHDYRDTGDFAKAECRYNNAIKIFKQFNTQESGLWLKEAYEGLAKAKNSADKYGYSSLSAMK